MSKRGQPVEAGEAGKKRQKRPECEHPLCQKRPSYNTNGETKARFCSKHKHDGMIDVLHKRCETKGCQKQPTFNMDGETKPRFCSEHKLNGMVNVRLPKAAHLQH